MSESESVLHESTTPTEDVSGADIARAARNIGLKRIRAWVPDDEQAKRNRNAERIKRSREKAEAQGLRQLSITLPAELHPLLRTFAARTKAGEPFQSVLADLIDKRHPQHVNQGPAAQAAVAEEAAPTIRNLPAWRRALIWWLLSPELRSVLG